MKSGFVSIIGRPNVGKSTLLNSLIKTKVAITSDKTGTTRNIIEGIYNDDDTQIVFVDTPGIHKPINKLGKVLNKQAQSLTEEVDAVLFLVDADSGIGPGDKYIMEKLRKSDSPVILILNKIDLITKEELITRISMYNDFFNFAEIVPTSALTGENVDHLIGVIKKYLTDNNRYFDEELYTTNTEKFMIAEYVREKILRHTNEEIPHTVACIVSDFQTEGNLVRIMVDVIVERDAIKKIIIGKSGQLIKQIGIEARADIERLLDKKVYLELYVKTMKKWRDKDRAIYDLGFHEIE